jgi:hypothetical protein
MMIIEEEADPSVEFPIAAGKVAFNRAMLMEFSLQEG